MEAISSRLEAIASHQKLLHILPSLPLVQWTPCGGSGPQAEGRHWVDRRKRPATLEGLLRRGLRDLRSGWLLGSMRRQWATPSSNRCLTSSNKKLLETSATLVVTGALLVSAKEPPPKRGNCVRCLHSLHVCIYIILHLADTTALRLFSGLWKIWGLMDLRDFEAPSGARWWQPRAECNWPEFGRRICLHHDIKG